MSKFCFRCKMAITSKERKITIIDDDDKETYGKKYMHKKCWSDFVTNKQKQNTILDMASNFMIKANDKLEDGEKIVNF